LTSETYFEIDGVLEKLKTFVYDIDVEKVKFESGFKVKGPSILLNKTSTIIIEPLCEATVFTSGSIMISVEKKENLISKDSIIQLDPIVLSIFSHRFMSIAEQMGDTLQKTSVSTNIKE